MTMIRTITAIMMILNFIILGILYYMLFWPVKFTTIYNEPFPVYPQNIARGEELTYTIEYEKYKHYNVSTEQAMICKDGNLVTLATRTSNLPIGRHTVNFTIRVPMKASVSTCYIELKQIVKVNPLRVEHMVMRTQDFTITK